MSVDSFMGSGSGVSTASVYGGGTAQMNPPNRRVFLDTELPSPGLGGLFDTLGTNSVSGGGGGAVITAEQGQAHVDVSSSAPTSAAASSTTFDSSNSSGFFSAGRFTPSPARTSDDDLEERGIAHESARLRVLTERLGNMRDEMLNEMLRWGERDDESALSDEMDVDGDQPQSRNVSALLRGLLGRILTIYIDHRLCVLMFKTRQSVIYVVRIYSHLSRCLDQLLFHAIQILLLASAQARTDKRELLIQCYLHLDRSGIR
jgi:hypothetical protein